MRKQATELEGLPDPHQHEDFDPSLVRAMLALTPTQRLERHEQFRQFLYAAREARVRHYGFDPAVPREAE